MHQPGAPGIDPGVFDLGVPVLGICYGQQLMAPALGGEVGRTGVAEFGKAELTVDAPSSVLFKEQPAEQIVWMSHNDAVVSVPGRVHARRHRRRSSPVAAFEDRERSLFGVQFHPEVVHSEQGTEVLKNFLYEGATCCPSWTMTSIIESSIDDIRSTVGSEKIVCALSGGVDSSVAAALVHRAVGDQLTCVFVDHGLLRAGEAEQVEDTFRRHLEIDLIHVKAADRFLENLSGVTDPEQQAEDHRRDVHQDLRRGRPRRARGCALPRPGHALSRT